MEENLDTKIEIEKEETKFKKSVFKKLIAKVGLIAGLSLVVAGCDEWGGSRSYYGGYYYGGYYFRGHSRGYSSGRHSRSYKRHDFRGHRRDYGGRHRSYNFGRHKGYSSGHNYKRPSSGHYGRRR